MVQLGPPPTPSLIPQLSLHLRPTHPQHESPSSSSQSFQDHVLTVSPFCPAEP